MYQLMKIQIKRRALCLLLTLTMLSPTAPDIFARSINPTSAASVAATDDDDKDQLTLEEETEARRIASLVAERLEATHDYATIVRDFYQPNFIERLREKERDAFPFVIVNDETLYAATIDDLKRYYVAQLNVMNLMWRIDDFREARQERIVVAKSDGETSDDNSELTAQEILTPEIVAVYKNDPFWGKAFDTDEDGNARSIYCGDDDGKLICTVPLLNSVGDMSKKVLPLLLDRYKTLRAEELGAAQIERAKTPNDTTTITPAPTLDADSTQTASEEARAEDETEQEFEIQLRTSNSEYRGYPPHTRIVCVTSKKHSLHLDFAPDANGKLQLLPVVLYFD